jgi:transcriptional regulator with XRE-family HTH domain
MTDATDFGLRLRARREQRGISLQQIADQTKINAGLLADLERGDLFRWPAGIFGRAFVRSYAEAIGLEPREVLNEYVRFAPADNAAPRGALEAAEAPLLPGWAFRDARPRPRPVPAQPAGIRLTLDESDSGATTRAARLGRGAAACAADAAILGAGAGAGALALPGGGWLAGLAAAAVALVVLASAAGTTPGRRLFGPPADLAGVRGRGWRPPRLMAARSAASREDDKLAQDR